MNPLLAQALGSVVRSALTLLVPFLVARGIWTPEEATQYVTAATLAIVALGWSLWQKYGSRVDFVNALRAPANTGEDTVKAMPAPPVVAAKVLSLLLVVGLAFTAGACAKRGGVNVSPEGTLALRGNQFVQALRTTITPEGASPIEQLVASKAITPDDAIQVVTAVRQTLVYAQDLAVLLKVADSAQTEAERSTGLVKASKIAQSASDSLAQASLSVGTEAGRRAVVSALRTASQALLLVGSVFPAGAF